MWNPKYMKIQSFMEDEFVYIKETSLSKNRTPENSQQEQLQNIKRSCLG